MKQITKTIALDILSTEKGIKLVKDTFEKELSKALCLQRVSAPRFLKVGTGLQDDLAGLQEPVSFKAKGIKERIECVHSLAKWKRFALYKYHFPKGTGLYTDMDAIRKDEVVDDIHSFYVDQWDWEKVLSKEERTIPYLQSTVKKIYAALKKTEEEVVSFFPHIRKRLPESITFIHAEDLMKEYPLLSPSSREKTIAQKYGAVFIIGIGHHLSDGKFHDARASDYDDWSSETSEKKFGLNGDIIVWDDIRKKHLELSSMGIRVDKTALKKQLSMMKEDKKELYFHKGILEEVFPLTIGGGIGQSRMCMILLGKKHIGEVQASVWPESEEGIFL